MIFKFLTKSAAAAIVTLAFGSVSQATFMEDHLKNYDCSYSTVASAWKQGRPVSVGQTFVTESCGKKKMICIANLLCLRKPTANKNISMDYGLTVACEVSPEVGCPTDVNKCIKSKTVTRVDTQVTEAAPLPGNGGVQ